MPKRTATATSSPDPGRRRLLAGALAGIGGTVLVGACGPAAFAAETIDDKPGAPRPHNVMKNCGAGMHSGPDTALGLSTFTINPYSVTCGVGSMGNSPGSLPGTAGVPTGLGTTGPFAMMMFAQSIDTYDIDSAAHTIRASGTMRSITTAGNQTIEDVHHPFFATAVDNQLMKPDEFHLHFLTPFWNPGSNPMATRSSYDKTWSMFGSAIVLGTVNVS